MFRRKLIKVKPNKWDKRLATRSTTYVKLAMAESLLKDDPTNKKLKRKVNKLRRETVRQYWASYWNFFDYDD